MSPNSSSTRRLAQQAFVFSEPYVARQRGSDPHCLMVSDLGFNPYPSLLIASQESVQQNPDLVRKMVTASIQGWRQYLQEPAAANRLLSQQNNEMSPEILDYGAQQLRPLCVTNDVPIERLGQMTLQRWRTLAQQLEEVGRVVACRSGPPGGLHDGLLDATCAEATTVTRISYLVSRNPHRVTGNPHPETRANSMRIVIGYPANPYHLQQISAAAPDAEVVDAGQQRIPEEILQADIFCGHAKERPVPWDEVVARGRLRWIQSSAAGLDHCLTPSVIQSDITVTSASGLFADQVAEQTLALLLGLLRSLPVFFRASLRREFIRRPTRDLHHATVGIVGFGGNGRRLAEVLAPFRTQILATDVFPVHKPPQVTELWPADRLDDLLAASDIVILCIPLNRRTKGMIAAEQLARMKPGAILINVARGQVVVERDLIAALESGHLAGAGLDVTETEPLPPTSKLWELRNVIITPHVGAGNSSRK